MNSSNSELKPLRNHHAFTTQQVNTHKHKIPNTYSSFYNTPFPSTIHPPPLNPPTPRSKIKHKPHLTTMSSYNTYNPHTRTPFNQTHRFPPNIPPDHPFYAIINDLPANPYAARPPPSYPGPGNQYPPPPFGRGYHHPGQPMPFPPFGYPPAGPFPSGYPAAGRTFFSPPSPPPYVPSASATAAEGGRGAEERQYSTSSSSQNTRHPNCTCGFSHDYPCPEHDFAFVAAEYSFLDGRGGERKNEGGKDQKRDGEEGEEEEEEVGYAMETGEGVPAVRRRYTVSEPASERKSGK